MPARVKTPCASDHRATGNWLTPVFLAIALLVASRTTVCVVIAADQESLAAAQAGGEKSADTEPPTAAAAEATESRTTDSNPIDKPAAEISDNSDWSKLNITADDASPSSGSIRTLSVEPGSVPLLPADKPAWVGSPPDLSSKQHRVFVGSSPEATPEAAEQSLDAAIEVALREYIDAHVLNESGASARLPITADYARKNLLLEPAGYLAELTTSDGPMFQKWVILEVSPEQREQFNVWHIEAIQRTRLGKIGFGLLLLLTSTGSAHLILSRRNRFSAPPPRAVDTPPMAVSKPKRPRSLFRSAALTVCLLAVAVPAVRAFRGHNSFESRESRTSVEVRHEAHRAKAAVNQLRAKALRPKHREKDA